MLKRDFILVQIEELGKMVAQMTLNRNANDGARENPELIQSVYDSLRIDADFLLRGTPEEIHRTLNRDDDHGLPRMEVAAKTLLEESFLAPEPHRLRAKAKELLEYIQREDTTFSLERMALLADIDSYRAGCTK